MSDKVRDVIHEAEDLSRQAAPPDVSIPAPLDIPNVRVGRIFLFLAIFYASSLIIRFFFVSGPSLVTVLKQVSRSVPPEVAPSVIFDFFLYMCLASQFFPLPTLPAIAFAAKMYDPIVVSLVGALGTCMANLNDYAILGWLFRHHRVKKVRDIRSYRRLLLFFDRYAFLTLTTASFLPIPIDVIRLLAISRAYSFTKYILATIAGRFPRYLIIAYLGKELPAKYILILFLLTALPAVVKFVSDMIKKKKSK